MVFDITKYSGNYGMSCPDEYSAEVFTEFLHKMGRHWRGGATYQDNTNFSVYKDQTVYDFNSGQYGSYDWFIGNEYTILYFYDFDWDCGADSKESDVIPMTFDEMFFGVPVVDNSSKEI